MNCLLLLMMVRASGAWGNWYSPPSWPLLVLWEALPVCSCGGGCDGELVDDDAVGTTTLLGEVSNSPPWWEPVDDDRPLPLGVRDGEGGAVAGRGALSANDVPLRTAPHNCCRKDWGGAGVGLSDRGV